MSVAENAVQSFDQLKAYVEKHQYKGWDPYDGLTSKIFQATPLKYSSLARLAWIQFFKRSPVNLRRLLLVKEDFNPKGLALFLSGYTRIYQKEKREEDKKAIEFLLTQIKKLQSTGYSGSCWGYPFDWQARAFFQPKQTPTVVATTYVAHALLDAFAVLQDEELVSIARSSCNFILTDLNRTAGPGGSYCFSYSPLDKTQVYNASLLASRLLARVYAHTHEPHLLEAATRSVEYCCAGQHEDGSWAYGTLPFHSWVDNFHTGFNLECLNDYKIYSEDESFNKNFEVGFDYYMRNFFTSKGESKYYNNTLYPIDIHSPAQLIVVLKSSGRFTNHQALAERVLQWTITHMQHEEGYFYYQVKKAGSSKIPYMRWAQAWMFYALSVYLELIEDGTH